MCENCGDPNHLEKAIQPFTKKGTLKKQFRDLPRYPVIFEYEKLFTDDYVKTLKGMTYDLSKKIGITLMNK